MGGTVSLRCERVFFWHCPGLPREAGHSSIVSLFYRRLVKANGMPKVVGEVHTRVEFVDSLFFVS